MIANPRIGRTAAAIATFMAVLGTSLITDGEASLLRLVIVVGVSNLIWVSAAIILQSKARTLPIYLVVGIVSPFFASAWAGGPFGLAEVLQHLGLSIAIGIGTGALVWLFCNESEGLNSSSATQKNPLSKPDE